MRKLILICSIYTGLLFVGGCDYLSNGGWRVSSPVTESQTLPDFRSIADVDERKVAFTDYLLPMITNQNRNILADRQLLLRAQQLFMDGQALNHAPLTFLQLIAARYKVDYTEPMALEFFEELTEKIDLIPEGLVLAQAANESGWGTSRFAQQGNNLFGQWCLKPGCGLVPNARSAGLTHEVEKFNSPESSLASYMLNLNTHAAYQKLRELRAQQRQQNVFNAADLAHGLINYSERGEEYVDELQQMIRVNSDMWPQTEAVESEKYKV